jgi:hypothetical protein
VSAAPTLSSRAVGIEREVKRVSCADVVITQRVRVLVPNATRIARLPISHIMSD